METRHFNYTDAKSNKFWWISWGGKSITVNYGKIGTLGSGNKKEFADEASCLKEVKKLIAEKIKKGYVEETEDNPFDYDSENDIEDIIEDGIELEEIIQKRAKEIKIKDAPQYAKVPEQDANKIYELALEDDKNIPQFIDFQRKVRPGGGDEQLEQIAQLLSDTDNGLRLLAACCVYAIDQPDTEENLEDWISEYVGDDGKKQEKLFKYMLTEVANWDARVMGNLNEFLVDYFTETLNAMGVEYDEEALAELLESPEDLDVKKLPKLSSIISQ